MGKYVQVSQDIDSSLLALGGLSAQWRWIVIWVNKEGGEDTPVEFNVTCRLYFQSFYSVLTSISISPLLSLYCNSFLLHDLPSNYCLRHSGLSFEMIEC